MNWYKKIAFAPVAKQTNFKVDPNMIRNQLLSLGIQQPQTFGISFTQDGLIIDNNIFLNVLAKNQQAIPVFYMLSNLDKAWGITIQSAMSQGSRMPQNNMGKTNPLVNGVRDLNSTVNFMQDLGRASGAHTF